MESESSVNVDLFYVTYVMGSQEEALSLTEYLVSHGIEALSSSSSEVVIPLKNPSKIHYIYQLRHNWVDYWNYHMSALIDLPVYVRD